MATLHLVSHTHWDREWYLPFQVFRLKLVHLLDRLLALLAADPAYRYFMLDGQTVVLDDYLALRPEREAEIRAYVQEGRLLIGPWHILPDEFLVSPESTVRNLLQGERTARRFGSKMAVGYIPDPFGHIGQMPQILRGFGIAVAALRRGLADEPCELQWQAPDGSCVFLAYLRDGYDNAAWLPLDHPDDLERFLTGICRLRDSLAPYTASGHILLMHGTDHMESQALTTAALAYAEGNLEGDTLVHSTLPAYLEAVQEAVRERALPIPTVVGELRNPKRHHLLPGVLSARMWIKQRNQAGETLLEKWVEPFSTWASCLEEKPGESAALQPGSRLVDPAPLIRQAWRLLMECHPHDSICGCSVDQVHEEMRARFDQVEQIGEELTRQSLAAIAAAADTTVPAALDEGEAAVLVFNPVAGPRTGAVTVQIELPPGSGGIAVVDEAGQVIPHALVGVESQEIDYRVLDRAGLLALLEGMDEGRIGGRAIRTASLQREGEALRIEVTLAEAGRPEDEALSRALLQLQAALADPALNHFIVRSSSRLTTVELIAPGVPGYGYRTFWVRSSLPPAPLPSPQSGEGRGEVENEYLALAASPADGTLTVTDKRTGAVFFGLNRFVDGGDCGDEYNYSPPAGDALVSSAAPVSVRVRADGQAIEVTYELPVPAGLSDDRHSRSAEAVSLSIRTVARLYPGVPRVDIITEVENRAGDHRLRAHFPTSLAVAAADHDGHFEVVRRPLGVPPYDGTWGEQPRPEVPQRAFTDVSDGRVGLMVANRGLPEVEVLRREDGTAEVALTLLRCVGWLSRADFRTRRGHAGPALPTPGAQMPGRHRFAYAVIPHAGGWKEACAEAYAFAAPLRAVATTVHPGVLPGAAALLRVEPAAFVLSAVKMAEDGQGIIVRGYNVGAGTLHVTLVPWCKFARAARVRLDEQEEGELALDAEGGVRLLVRGHEVVSVRFQKAER